MRRSECCKKTYRKVQRTVRDGEVDVSIRDVLRQYIGEELLEEEGTVEDDENLLTDGMVDSMGMLRLVAFIDETWDIIVPPEDFTIENFRTIADLDRYLAGKLGAPETAIDGG